MPRRSKARLSKEDLEALHEDLYSLFTSISKDNLMKFMREFLTTEEQVMISKRFMLYKLLFQEVDLFEIQQGLGISRETTRIYAQSKNHRSDFFKQVIFKSIKNTDREKIKQKISEAIKPLEYALNAKTNMKARAKLLP
jgi:uncharacterized protein YerC